QRRLELGQGEGLDEVRVATQVEAFDAIGELTAGGQEQDGRADAGTPERPCQGEAVEAGQHHVEDEGVVLAGACQIQPGRSVAGHRDAVATLLEGGNERSGYTRVVLDQQEPHRQRLLAIVYGSDAVVLMLGSGRQGLARRRSSSLNATR